MPLTRAAGRVGRSARCTDLGWTESLLVGALLLAHGPGALVDACVTNPRVPRARFGHSLRPRVAGSTTAWRCRRCSPSRRPPSRDDDFVWWQFVLQDVGVGAASPALRRGVPRGAPDAARATRRDVAPHQKALYALGVAFAAYGAAVCRRRATASSRCSWRRSRSGSGGRTSASASSARSEDVLEVVKLGVFLVFGADLHASTRCSRTAGPPWRSWPSRWLARRRRGVRGAGRHAAASTRTRQGVHGLVRARRGWRR